MRDLSTEVILKIIDLLPTELDKFSFASTSIRHWGICSSPTDRVLNLNANITALQLRKHRVVIVQDQYYHKNYLKHVFHHASHLKTIILDDRSQCSFKFALMLLHSADVEKKIKFVVPEKFERKFKIIVEEDQMSHTDQEESLTSSSTTILRDMVRSPVDQLFDKEAYNEWQPNINDNDLMAKTDLNAAEADEIVNEYGLQMMESVVILDGYWFLTTSCSMFVHNNSHIDDCADLSRVGHQAQAVAFIRRKTRLGKDYFELTYRFGYMEALATSGFFGSVDDASFTPFLGSALRELPTSITASLRIISTHLIFVATEQQQYLCKNRILNQYCKLHAVNNWGFLQPKIRGHCLFACKPVVIL
ncbi:hypothetical protein MBANPS3_007037 [Mucor bainieri]